MRASGHGLAEFHCKRCVERRASHGSYWAPTILATDLKPYLQSAAQWIKQHRTETFIRHALLGLKGLLDGAGRAEPAQDIKWRSAPSRGRIAFARLREANVKPKRLLAIHMAVSALIEDDAGSHRVTEYRIVQVAKCGPSAGIGDPSALGDSAGQWEARADRIPRVPKKLRPCAARHRRRDRRVLLGGD
jgi:hypothetical protein